MSTRWLVWLFAPIVLVVLVFVGRGASSAGPAAPTDADTTDAASESEDAAEVGALADASDAASASAVEVQPDGAVVVDLNRATETELRKLPGVGPQKARAIVELRVRIGGIKRVEDLTRIKGFGRASIRKLRPFVRVGAK
jgi:competence protein ComEA